MIGFEAVKRLLAGAFALTFTAAQSPGHADDQAGRLKLAALIEEAQLILDEAHALQPAADQLAAEGAQLDTTGAGLQADSANLNQAIGAFNAANVELERQVNAHQAACPSESQDKALVESCNARTLELRPVVLAHEAQRPALQQRQEALQQRIEAHNAARREWVARNRELDPKLQANRKDADYWLGEARAFVTGDAFRRLAKNADASAACDARMLGDPASPLPSAAVGRVHTCLKAVAGAPQ